MVGEFRLDEYYLHVGDWHLIQIKPVITMRLPIWDFPKILGASNVTYYRWLLRRFRKGYRYPGGILLQDFHTFQIEVEL